MALIDTPDIYGYTLFCDDVRLEATGARSIIGMYTGAVFLHGAFPITIPKFAFLITLAQRATIFNPNVGIHIFLPGDSDDKPSLQAAMGEVAPGAIEAQIKQQQIAPQSSDVPYYAMHGSFIFTQMVIKTAGVMKVRAVIGENTYRLGALTVAQGPLIQTTPKASVS